MADKKPSANSDRLDLEGDNSDAEDRAKHVHWADEIKRSKKVFKEWHDRSKKILKLYKDERGETVQGLANKSRMNILWSNVSVLQPALYSRTPDPNVSRRFLDKDPVSRTASLIVERNLSTAMDVCDFDYPMKRMRDDYLLVGRGTVWVRYAPEIGQVPMKEPVTKIDMGESGVVYRPMKGGEEIDPKKIKTDKEIGEYYETEPVDQVLSYGLELDHVIWSRFLHEPVESWKKVGWLAKSTLMKRKELVKNFGKKIGNSITLNRTFERDDGGDTSDRHGDEPNACEVWEIWCRTTKTVVWWSEAYPQGLLKEQEDPLHLSDFFPCPRPIWATTTTDSLVPVPDYCLYQDQADQIDKLTDRIRLLTQALRVVGVFNAASAGLQQLLEEGQENEMIPVDNWVWFSGTGGLKGNVDWFPIEQVSNVLKSLFETRAQLRQDLYEVTGISDIIRGSTMASETATAQQIKANFGNLRLQDRQTEMSRIARDTMRIMAEIQCEHYPEDVLLEMSGILESDEFKNGNPEEIDAAVQKAASAVQLVKEDKLRTFKLDIETDATVAANQEKEKQSRVEFLTAVSPFLEKAVQVGQSAPETVPLLLKMLDFGVRGFRTGRTLESAIEQFIETAEKAQQEAEKNPQPDQPDPEVQAKAEKLQTESAKIKAEIETHNAASAAKAEETKFKAQEMISRAQEAKVKYDLEVKKLNEEIEFRREENRMKIAELEASIELKKVQMQQATEAGALKEIQNMLIPEEEPEVIDELAPLRTETEGAELHAKRKKAEYDLAEHEAKLRDFKSKDEILGHINAGLTGEPTEEGGIPTQSARSPADIMSHADLEGVMSAPPKPLPAPPAPPAETGQGFSPTSGASGPMTPDNLTASPMKKKVTFIRDPNGSINGADIEG